MNEEDFYKLWNKQKITHKERLITYLKSNSYFGEFSDQTIYLIVYELMETRNFEPGTMIIAQAKRSPLNFYYNGFYLDMISKIGMKIKKSNEERNRRLDRDDDYVKEDSPSEDEAPFQSSHMMNAMKSIRRGTLRNLTIESYENYSKRETEMLQSTIESVKEESSVSGTTKSQDNANEQSLRDKESDGN